MIERAVILAAGLGTRLREPGVDLPKPLREVGGEPLLHRSLAAMAAVGVRDAWVVVGHRADEVRAALAAWAAEFAAAGLAIHTIFNPAYAGGLGLSVLVARGVVPGPFILSMSDHVYDVEVARVAAGADMTTADLVLCVDRRLDEVYDMDDATKVRTVDGRIVDIGKELPVFDCVDCGMFAIGDALLDALAAEQAARGDFSLSDGVRRLAAGGRARVADIGAAFWQDVDTPGARTRADAELARLAAERR
ncbi:MAG: NTP transferase domain-containing protein [Kofleriaceae bacterium]